MTKLSHRAATALLLLVLCMSALGGGCSRSAVVGGTADSGTQAHQLTDRTPTDQVVTDQMRHDKAGE